MEGSEVSTNNKGRAVPFVIYSNKKFVVTDEAKEVLCKQEYKNISIISLVGKYRTGKSFLLNRVLLNQKKESGFDVGPTIRPCTKGIWMWSEPLYIENNHCKEKFPVFMIDTEGLGAYDEEINHDSKIFLIAVLVSSLFIFNSFGSIDENSINSLSFILNLSKTIKLSENSSTNESSELAKCFPGLLWLLRDFSLKLEDSEGNTITAKQYLENALQLSKGSSQFVEEKNKVRKLITTYFTERDCFSMVRPVEDEKELQNLQTLDDSKIRKEFHEQAETLRNKVSKKVKPKMLNNKTMNGSILVELLKSILDSINQGSIPVIENSWKYVMHNEGIKNMNEQTQKFMNKIKKFKEENKENQTFFSDLDQFEKTLEKELIEEFQKMTVADEIGENEFTGKLKAKFAEEYKKFNEENNKFFESKMLESLEKNTKKLIDTFETEKYAKNYYQFFQDLENLKEITEASTPDFPMKKEIIFEKMIKIVKKFIEMNFLKNKITNEKEIVTLKNEVYSITSKLNIKSEEYEALKLESKEMLEKVNSQLVELKQKEKSTEEKCRLIESDKKSIANLSDKKLNDLRKELEDLNDKFKKEKSKFDSDLKSKDDQIMTLKFAEEKMASLNNMKVEFYEKEIASHKERYESVKKETNDYRTLNEELTNKLEDLKTELNKLKVFEFECEKLKSERTEKEKPRNKRESIYSSYNQIEDSCNEEKKVLTLIQTSIDVNKSQMENNKKMFEEIINAVREQNVNDIITSNKILTDSLANYEIKCRKLEDTISQLKNIKRLIKSSLALQCRTCTKLFAYENFRMHWMNCTNKPSEQEKVCQDKIRIKILKGILNKDELGKAYIDYIVEISCNSTTWRCNKKFTQFSNLHKSLKGNLPSEVKMPESGNIFSKVDLNSKESNSHHENKIKQIEKYLKDISEMEQVIKSKIFRKFFDFEDYIDDSSNLKISQDFRELKNNTNNLNNVNLFSPVINDAILVSDEDVGIMEEEGKSNKVDTLSEDGEKSKEIYRKKSSMTSPQNKIVTMNVNIGSAKDKSKKQQINITQVKPKQNLNTSVIIKKAEKDNIGSTGKLNSSMTDIVIEKKIKKRNTINI